MHFASGESFAGSVYAEKDAGESSKLHVAHVSELKEQARVLYIKLLRRKSLIYRPRVARSKFITATLASGVGTNLGRLKS